MGSPDAYYATTQKQTKVYAGEFLVEPGGGTGLTEATKFDLVNYHPLPFDAVWFEPAPGKSPAHPRRGRLNLEDMTVKRKIQAAITEAKGQRKPN